MANTFKLRVADNVTASTTIYTVPANTTAVVIGLIVANNGADGTVSVTVTDSSTATSVSLLAIAPIPTASNIAVLSNNNRLVLETGDSISVTASVSMDVALSIMEITA